MIHKLEIKINNEVTIDILLPDGDFITMLLNQTGMFNLSSDKYLKEISILYSNKLKQLLVPSVIEYFKNCIDQKKQITILDIGCGHSILDIALYKYFQLQNIENVRFILVDGNEFNANEKAKYSVNHAPYNSWDQVYRCIHLNGCTTSHFINVDYKHAVWSQIPVNLVISTGSWGWHYPVSLYLDKVNSIMEAGGLLFLHPLIGIDDPLAVLNSKFKTIESHTYENTFGVNQYGNYEDEYWENIPGWHRGVAVHTGIWQKSNEAQ